MPGQMLPNDGLNQLAGSAHTSATFPIAAPLYT